MAATTCPDRERCVDIEVWGWRDVIDGKHRWRWGCTTGVAGPACDSLAEALASCAEAHGASTGEAGS